MADLAFEERVEDVILSHGDRGMDVVRQALEPGYCARAAESLLKNKGRVLIATGFPVEGTFETDGPLGAIALYRVLEYLGSKPEFICAPPISRVLETAYRTREIPILSRGETLPLVKSTLSEVKPSLVISIERPGAAADENYYNMRKRDISDRVGKLDLFFKLCECPTIGIGDGGNEIGMGNAAKALSGLPIIPSVTTCSELVIATVSNWGVYGIVASLSRRLGESLFTLFNPKEIIEYLVSQGAVDGKTGNAEPTEDGFNLDVGLSIIASLEELL